MTDTLFQNIIDYAPDAIVAVDECGMVTIWNPMAETLFGWTSAEMIGHPLFDRIAPEHQREDYRQGVAGFLASGADPANDRRIEMNALHREGYEFPVELSVSGCNTDDGYTFTAFIHDISGRKATERRLRRDVDIQNAISSILRVSLENIALEQQLEKTLYILLELPWHRLKSQGCIFLTDGPDTPLRLVAQRNLAPELLVACATVPLGHCLCGRAGATGEMVFAGCVDERHETRFEGMQPHGHYCTPIDNGGQLLGVLNLYVDEHHEADAELESFLRTVGDTLAGVIERKRAEEQLEATNRALTQANRRLEEAQNQLLQSEKMASIGQLAAGVAHEINNPVGYIQSNLGALGEYVVNLTQLVEAYRGVEPLLVKTAPEEAQRLADLRRRLDIDYLCQDIAELIGESQEGVARVRQIVRDLKEFSHVGESEMQCVDLHAGLESTLNVVWNEIKYKAEVIKEFGDLPQVECLPQQINQVFMNLLVNAAQAIEERGVITLRTGHEGEWCWIEVADSGSGIPPEQLNRIFDPFFTTKPVGHGTGLGLAVSYGIINKHHGRIEVDSTPGEGTTFRIWLPVTQNDSSGSETAVTAEP